MFIGVPFIISTGLAIVAEANLRRGDFLSEKFLFFFFLSFWSGLRDIPRVFINLIDRAAFLGVDNAFFNC